MANLSLAERIEFVKSVLDTACFDFRLLKMRQSQNTIYVMVDEFRVGWTDFLECIQLLNLENGNQSKELKDPVLLIDKLRNCLNVTVLYKFDPENSFDLGAHGAYSRLLYYGLKDLGVNPEDYVQFVED